MSIIIILDECCYIYGSIPKNEVNCVPEGESLTLTYIIFNPHDNFTNLTVTWFRSIEDDITSTFEILSTDYYDHHSSSTVPVEQNLVPPVTNCSLDIYRDTFSITLNSFTGNESGYYWCQMSINNSYVQPSHRAFFYINATNCSDTCYPYFRPAVSNEPKCANTSSVPLPVVITSKSLSLIRTPVFSSKMTIISTTNTLTTKSLTISLAMTATVTQHEKSTAVSSMTLATRLSTAALTMTSTDLEKEISSEVSRPLITYYVAGSLSAVVLILGTLVIVLSIMYLCKFQRRKTSMLIVAFITIYLFILLQLHKNINKERFLLSKFTISTI